MNCQSATPTPSYSIYHPQKLTQEEIDNPYQVIHNLFDFDHLPGIREMLWEFFKTTITGNYSHDLGRRERFLLVEFYQYLEKLVEAAHIIDTNRKAKEPVVTSFPVSTEHFQTANLEQLADQKAIDPKDLNAVIENIVAVTNAEKVFLAGLSRNGEQQVLYDFLVVLPPGAPLSYKSYQTHIEDRCNSYGSILTWCIRITDLCPQLEKGHLFYSGICLPHRLVYDTGEQALPGNPHLDTPVIKVTARDAFTELFELAKSFLDGAEYYATSEQRKAAAFLLHQAAEHALRALLLPFNAWTTYGHNLKLLIRHCSHCAPELNQLFPQNTEEEKHLFRQLNTAYVASRYRTGYEITQAEVMTLLDRVNTLQSEVQQLFEEKLIAFDMLTAQTDPS